jgi:A/G-specific adenine glycosylase
LKNTGQSTKTNQPLSPKSVKRLVSWYQKRKRDLPWRKTRDPYKIWVSEILLQQTQVTAVQPYYARFLKAFPTVQALATASEDAVLKAWEGCGYYARARNLHKAAKLISESGGKLPTTQKQLVKLPGIGPYTAAAIASIAFGEAASVVDGNVERVLARVLCSKAQNSKFNTQVSKAADKIMRVAVEQNLAPGDVNQALMEIGATICKPRAADCPACPLNRECRATLRLADPTVLPKKVPARQTPHYQVTAAIIRKNGKILITKRPSEGLLGGLWEFPGGKQEPNESLEECVRREIEEELGIQIAVYDQLAKVNHAYSHFRITLHAFNCTHVSGRAQKLGVADYKWVAPTDLPKYAFPKADRVILDLLETEQERLL